MKRTKIATVQSVESIKDPYTRRILSNIKGKDAFNIYCQTPARLQRLLRGLNERQLRTAPAQGKWSITQIINHLCDAEAVFAYRMRMILSQSGCPIQAYDENAWAKHLRYDQSDCREKSDLFARLRADHVRTLQSLRGPEWRRFGVHEERGKETLERLVQMYAGHDVNHRRQVEQIRKSLKETLRKP